MRTVPDAQIEILPPRGPALRLGDLRSGAPLTYVRPRVHPEERRRSDRRAGEPQRGRFLDLRV